jgi:hypothetical protein
MLQDANQNNKDRNEEEELSQSETGSAEEETSFDENATPEHSPKGPTAISPASIIEEPADSSFQTVEVRWSHLISRKIPHDSSNSRYSASEDGKGKSIASGKEPIRNIHALNILKRVKSKLDGKVTGSQKLGVEDQVANSYLKFK